MKVNTVLLALFSATLGSSSLLRRSSEQAHIQDEFKVPGSNPLYYCSDPSEYIGNIDFVDLTPNPPVPGETLSIVANGTLSQDVVDGATVYLEVKWNKYVTLIKQTSSLCDNLPRIDLSCPLEKGRADIAKEVSIPKQVPPGTYDVLANALNVDGQTITCMKSSVHFGR